jgi:hypothetical protein
MLIAILLLAAFAQSPADFSGRWTLDVPAIATTPAVPGTPAAAAASGDLGSGWGSTITIAQDAKLLNIEYAFFSRYDAQPPLTFSYPLDGSEGRNTIMMGRGEQAESSRTEWSGSTLVIMTRHRVDTGIAGGQALTFTVTRKLSLESPTTLIVEVTREGILGGPSSKTRSVYRKG